MNKKILPILIAAGMLVLSGCGPSGLGYDDLDNLAISNKTEIQAAWLVGETERTLTFTTEPEINVTNEINNGHLVVTSSDVAVASVVGRVIMALSAGTATISVSYAEHVWDTVEVTISARPTNKDKFGTVHEGTLEDPLDNEDAITVGKWAKTEGNGSAFTTTEKFYISGVVDSFYHAPGSRTDGLVSWFLKPAEGKTEKFEVYKCAKNEDGDPLTWDDIWADGTAVAYGAITFYGNQMETPSALFVSCEGNKPEPQQTITATVTEALAVGAALTDGDSTYDLYAVTGYVVKKSGSDYYMAELATETVDANMLMIFAYTDTAGIMLRGAKVTATMSLKNYHGVVENSGTPTVVLITEGVAWEINYTDATVAEALVVANALADNATTSAYYKVTGVIVAITSAWSSQYGNMNFTIGDTAEDANLLLIYRLVCTEAESADFVVGASIVIGGQLKKYNTDLEMIAPVVFSVGEGGGEIQPEFAADLTLDFSNDYGVSATTVTTNTTFTVGSINYGYVNGKAGQKYVNNAPAGLEYLMLYNSGTPAGAFWNETAMASAINRIRITSGSGASSTAVYSLTVGTTSMAGSQPQASATEAFVIGTGASHIFDCSDVAGATFFNISAFTKNCQVAKLEIEFVAA
ncbi:MAG: hypothetical protein PHR89_01000 [Bacilli bacterium]|nr:hypothetical protein [Bacilli bacterium]